LSHRPRAVNVHGHEPTGSVSRGLCAIGYGPVAVRARTGVEGPLPECDVLYVSAGATAPLDVWLDALRPGGRLLFPLTSAQGAGAMLLVTRTGNGLAARFVCQALFIPCAGARDDQTAQKLLEAFKTGELWNFQRKGGLWDVQSLHRNSQPDNTCWFAGAGWWLSTEALDAGPEPGGVPGSGSAASSAPAARPA